MSDVVVLVPRRPDEGHRDRAWNWIAKRWAADFPAFPVVIGEHDDEGPFNRSAAINRAAEQAGDWKVAVIADADSFCASEQVIAAVNQAARTGLMTIAFERFCYLTQEGSRQVMRGFQGSWEPLIKSSFNGGCSSMVAVRRDLWDGVGGFDEQFVGWGEEDVAFSLACQTLGPPKTALATGSMDNIRAAFNRLPGDCWHLWHPTAVEGDDYRNTQYRAASEEYKANKARAKRYIAAAHNPEAMLTLIGERVPA